MMDLFKLTLAMIVVLCAPSPVKNINQCSLKVLDFQPCWNDVPSAASFEACCKTLTEAVQTGYSCMCSLLSSSVPIIGITLSLQLSNCYISMPSLAHCHRPPPAPILPLVPPARSPAEQMPPEIPKGQPQPSSPNDFLGPLPPRLNVIPLNSPPPIKNSTISTGQPTLSSNTHPESGIPEHEEKICSTGYKNKNIVHPRHLLVVAISAILCNLPVY